MTFDQSKEKPTILSCSVKRLILWSVTILGWVLVFIA